MNSATSYPIGGELGVLEVDGGQHTAIMIESELNQLKAAAGEDFKLGRFEAAMAQYERACSMLLSADTITSSSISPNGSGEIVVSWAQRQYAVCKANAAQCSINLNLPSQAIDLASEAIRSDPLNVKALYRRAVASLAVSSFASSSPPSSSCASSDLLLQNAISDLRKALLIEPDNKTVLKVINDVENIKSNTKKPIQVQAQLQCSNRSLQPNHDVSGNSSSSTEAGPMTTTSLMKYACLHGHLNECALLLESGINPRVRLQPDGSTPLFVASENGRLQVVQLLLSRGASVLDKTDNGISPLFMASYEGHHQVVDLLLRHGAPVDEKDIKNGCTPLYVASLNGHLKCAAFLLEAGANVNESMASSGATPLYIASREGRLDVVTFLVDIWKADINLKSSENTTPLFAAALKGRLEVVEFLLMRQAELDHKSGQHKWSPLFVAALTGHIDVVKRLLTGGARISGKDVLNRSCVSAARMQGHETIAQYINAWPVLTALACLSDHFIYIDFGCVEDLYTFLGQGCPCCNRCECNP